MIDGTETKKLPAKRVKRTIATATPLERSACNFVELLAQNVDENRGIITVGGTPETRADIAASVRDQFFSGVKK